MIKGMNHVGMSVVDLDRSVRFYRDVVGMELVVQTEFEGAMYQTILALDRAAGRVALLRIGNVQLELFQFTSPTPLRADPSRPVSNHGISHFCFQVSDIESEYQRLSAGGATFHCPPQDFGGTKATYGRDPDGNVFELIELRAEDSDASASD